MKQFIAALIGWNVMPCNAKKRNWSLPSSSLTFLVKAVIFVASEKW